MVSKLRGSTDIVSQPKFSLQISVISRELQFALAVLLYVSAVNNDDDDDDDILSLLLLLWEMWTGEVSDEDDVRVVGGRVEAVVNHIQATSPVRQLAQQWH